MASLRSKVLKRLCDRNPAIASRFMNVTRLEPNAFPSAPSGTLCPGFPDPATGRDFRNPYGGFEAFYRWTGNLIP